MTLDICYEKDSWLVGLVGVTMVWISSRSVGMRIWLVVNQSFGFGSYRQSLGRRNNRLAGISCRLGGAGTCLVGMGSCSICKLLE